MTPDNIFHNVMEAMQDSEEIFADMSLEEYIKLMSRIVEECNHRIESALLYHGGSNEI